MSNMFGPKMGTWWVKCKSDPRWDNTGRGEGFPTAGGPPELQNWIKRCRDSFGEPPADCEFGFTKD